MPSLMGVGVTADEGELPAAQSTAHDAGGRCSAHWERMFEGSHVHGRVGQKCQAGQQQKGHHGGVRV